MESMRNLDFYSRLCILHIASELQLSQCYVLQRIALTFSTHELFFKKKKKLKIGYVPNSSIKEKKKHRTPFGGREISK